MKYKKIALALTILSASLQGLYTAAMDSHKFDPITIEFEEVDLSTDLKKAILEENIKLMAELQRKNAPVNQDVLYALLECPNMPLVRRFFQEPINLDETTFLTFVNELIETNYTFNSPTQALPSRDYFNRFMIRLIGITGYCPANFINFFKRNVCILSTFEKIKLKNITHESIKKITQENLTQDFASFELCSYLFAAAASGNYNVLAHILESNKILMKPVKFGSSVIQNNYKNIFPPKCNLDHKTGTSLLVRLLQIALEFNQTVFTEKLLQLVDLTNDEIYTAVKTEITKGIDSYKKHMEKVSRVSHPSLANRNQIKLDSFTAQQKKLKKMLASQRQHKQLLNQSNILLDSNCTIPLSEEECCIVPSEIGLKILEYCPILYGKVDLEKDKKNKISSWKLGTKNCSHKKAQAFIAQFITQDKK